MDGKTLTLTKWREDWTRRFNRAVDMEKLGIDLGLPEGFEVRPTWPGLDWTVWGSHEDEEKYGTSLPVFRKMVEATAAVLGPADKVESAFWIGAYDGATPDLVAYWTIKRPEGEDDVRVTVRLMSPRGCSIKPGTEYQPGRTPELHPACAAALKELEEVG